MAQKNHRCCIACRKVAPKESFWRVVRVCSSQAVQLDNGMGRSAYLCPNQECLTIAQRKNRLGRSLRKPIPPEIYQQLAVRLAETMADPAQNNF